MDNYGAFDYYNSISAFDYNDWLAQYEDHEEVFQGNEDEAYERWKDEQC